MKKIKNLIIFLVLVGVIILIFFLSNKSSQKPEVTTIKPTTPTPALTYSTDPENNGGPVSDLPASDQKKYELIASLRKKIPFENDSFTLSFDYKNIVFIVTLKDGANADSFWDWINTYKYSEIPRDYFTFK